MKAFIPASMSSHRLRRTVGMIGLLVALVTAISLPLIYFAMSYINAADALSFQARLNSGYVAKYAYQNGAMWPFHKVRLHEVVELNRAKGTNQNHRIYAADGSLVLEEGARPAAPTMMRSAVIIVRGKVVGRVEVATSLLPTIINTSLTAVFSITLALLAFYPFRVLPMRLLDTTLGALETKANAALSSMSQGLCMYDASSRLIVSNRRFQDMYRLPDEAVIPGVEYARTLALSRLARDCSDRSLEENYGERLAIINQREPRVFYDTLSDGRVVAISHLPMEGGGWLDTHEDITDRRKAEEQIAHMAHHDALTDLPNRLFFKDKMDYALARVRLGEKLAVFFLDLDQFKAVNDTLGHPVGDILLREVATRLRGCVRDTDIVARLGGDEFAIARAITNELQVATVLAQRIIETLSAPYELDGHQVVIGVSIGIAVGPDDNEDANQLLKAADMALYRAKAEGRGTYRFFEAEMDARMQARRALELDLRSALPNGEFEVHYQPLINLKANKVSGFEALLRWIHPVRGCVPPADFIPLAEEIGAINQIGAWVLKQACVDATQWPDDIRVAVNLSAVQFKSQRLVLEVAAALGASGLSPQRLELEITESVMLHDTEATLGTLHQLRGLGVRVAMDDFGTGYSSLSYLRKFPFDKIKIDQSFVRDLPDQADSVAIVRAVTGLGTSLGMSTTAEGVETQGQLDRLWAEGCTEVQGWLFSKACPAAEVSTLLSSVPKRYLAAA